MENGQQEYLSGFCPTGVERIPWEVMVEMGVVYPPSKLQEMLFEAHDYLVAVPGPHQQRRRELGFYWFENWTHILSEKRAKAAVDSGVVLCRFGQVAAHVDSFHSSTESSGVLMMAGGEGHLGHLRAAEWVHHNVGYSVLLLEQDRYFERKPRGWPFLPLDMRLSMWYYSGLWSCVSVIPLLDPTVVDPAEVNAHYDRVFKETHVLFSFATEGDPFEKIKRSRGVQAGFTAIPRYDWPDTTTHVQRLMEDVELPWSN